MDRAQLLAALQKASIDTTVGADGMLSPQQSTSFAQVLKDKGTLSPLIRQEIRRSATGELNKITSGSRLLRGAPENTDDGYRAEVQFPTVDYTAKKVRLPWEITEDFFHENLEEQAVEAKVTDELTQQFSLDLEDLDVNGDEASGDAFVKINNGLLKLADTVSGVHKVDGAAINAGAIDKDHFFAGLQALPNKYLNTGRAKWLMSPSKRIQWIESLTERSTPAGDAALLGLNGDTPLGVDIVPVPSFTDTDIVLVDPQQLVRVLTWDIRRRRVTGDTDWELATRDKRGYIFFMKYDFVLEEPDAVVYIHDLDA